MKTETMTQRQKAIAMAFLVYDCTFDYFDTMEYDGRRYKWDGNFEGPIYYTQKAMAQTYDELERDPIGHRPSDMIAECAQEAGETVGGFIETVARKYKLGKPKRGAKE